MHSRKSHTLLEKKSHASRKEIMDYIEKNSCIAIIYSRNLGRFHTSRENIHAFHKRSHALQVMRFMHCGKDHAFQEKESHAALKEII